MVCEVFFLSYSLLALEPSALLAFACHPTSSRVIDAVFESSSAVSLRSKKKVVNTFVDQTYLLIDDRVGSRVADRLWAAADPYLKVGRIVAWHLEQTSH